MKNLSLNRLLASFLAMLLLVFSCSAVFAEGDSASGEIIPSWIFGPPAGGEKSSAEQNRDISLSLQIDMKKNKLLSRYNVDLYLDGEKLGTIEQGGQFVHSYMVASGLHTLSFVKETDASVKGVTQFMLSYDSSYSCVVQSKWNEVRITEEQLNHNEYSIDNLSEEAYKSLCSNIPWSDAARYPNTYKGMLATVNGTVKSISAFAYNDRFLYLTLEDSHKDEWYVSLILPADTFRILEGDKITVFGHYAGLDNNHTGGSYVQLLPTISCQFFECITQPGRP